ncbi:tail length tape measure protein [Stenotrophomonas phage vB_SmaS_Bhz59]
MTTERIDIVVSERGSRVVRRNLEGIGSGARKGSQGVDLLKRALAGIGIAVGLRELIQTIDAYTNLQNRLRSTGLEAQNLTGVYQALLKVANETRSSVEGSVELYSRLALSSKELGVSQQQLIDFTKSLNQAIILSGASATEAQAGLIQLSQGMASGTLRGDELRSVLEQLPAVADVIAKQLGVTRGELRKMGEDGKITAKTIVDAFQASRQELDERFGKTVPTISQSFMVLKNQIIDMFGRFDAATGFSEKLSKALLFVAENLDTIAKGLASVVIGITAVGGTVQIINGVRNAILLLNAAIAANPIGLLATVVSVLVTALASGVAALVLFRDEILLGVDDVTTLGDYMRALGEVIGQVFNDIVKWARETFTPLYEYIKKFLDQFDFSIAGILRASAKALDYIVGGWVTAVKAIIALFRGFGPAVADLVTQAVNKILGKLSDFINKAGAILSPLTEMLGMEAIQSIDLRLTNENEGAAKQLGADLMDAVKAGANFDIFQSGVESMIDRAKQIGAERRAAEEANQGTVGTTAGTPSPVTDPNAAKERKKLADELQQLISRYDGVYAAQMEYKEAVELLDKAEKAGLITAERKAQVLGLIKDQLKDALDPLGAVNREMDRELELLKLTADAREIESQLYAIQQDLRQQGVILGAEELRQLRERLQLIQEETRASEARNAVLAAIKDPQREFTEQLTAINDLLKAGTITQQEANAYLVQSQQDLLAGTLEAQAATLAAYQNTYAQIDALRQADLISEQTAQQLKARADVELAEKRLANQRTFFSTLAGLSSSENRKLAAIGKAAAVTQATIDGVLAVQKALSSAPPPANYALAAATGVVAAANVAQILAQNTNGYAFGGDFEVGGTGATDSQLVAFRATPGERVSISTPHQDREEARQDGGAAAQGGNVRIVNVIDPAMVGDFLATPEGETVLINTLRRNSDTVRQLSQGA